MRAGRFPGISWMCCCHFFSPRVVQGLCGGSRGGRGTLCPWSRQLTGAGRAKLDLRPRAGSLPLREKKGAGAQRDLPPANWGPLRHPWAGAGEPGVQPAVGTRSRSRLASAMLGGLSPLLLPPPFQVASPGSLEGLRPARGQPGLCVIETPPPAGAPGPPAGAGLGIMPCGCHPYILNDFLTSNLCFVSRVQRARGVLRASTALVTPVDVTVRVPMSTEPQWAAGAWGCTETAVGAGQACRGPARQPRVATPSACAVAPSGARTTRGPWRTCAGPAPRFRGSRRARGRGRPGPVLLRLSVPRARRRGDAGVALNRARPRGRRRPASRVRAAPPPQARNPYSCASYKIRIIQFQ